MDQTVFMQARGENNNSHIRRCVLPTRDGASHYNRDMKLKRLNL